jgi:hypothetical protein
LRREAELIAELRQVADSENLAVLTETNASDVRVLISYAVYIPDQRVQRVEFLSYDDGKRAKMWAERMWPYAGAKEVEQGPRV